MRKQLLLALAGLFLLAALLPAASITFYFDRTSWQAAANAVAPGQTTATFEGVAPVGGYVQPPLPFVDHGITFTHENASPTYFIVVDSAYPGGNYDIGSGAVAQFANTGYSGPNSVGRVWYPNMLVGGLDLYTVGASSDPMTAMMALHVGFAKMFFPSPGGTPGAPLAGFVGFVTDTPVGYFDLYSTDSGAYPTFDNVTVGAAVPEPSSVLLVGTGLLAAGLRWRRRLC